MKTVPQMEVDMPESAAGFYLTESGEVCLYLPEMNDEDVVPKHVHLISVLAILVQHSEDFISKVFDLFEELEIVKAQTNSRG